MEDLVQDCPVEPSPYQDRYLPSATMWSKRLLYIQVCSFSVLRKTSHVVRTCSLKWIHCLCAGGRHAMALTVDGKVFSWGEGDDGKLGHFSRMQVICNFNSNVEHIEEFQRDLMRIPFFFLTRNCDKPRLIEALKTKRIRDIACGSSHSAAITSSGELYSWGLGEYGRLGHGDNTTQLRPKMVFVLLISVNLRLLCSEQQGSSIFCRAIPKMWR